MSPERFVKGESERTNSDITRDLDGQGFAVGLVNLPAESRSMRNGAAL
jgi:hypothetical protein